MNSENHSVLYNNCNETNVDSKSHLILDNQCSVIISVNDIFMRIEFIL